MANSAADAFDTFGELLRYLRRRAQLTQRELGIAVGYSESQITRLENGQRLPDAQVVKTQFIEALSLEGEAGLASRLIELATAAATVQSPEQSGYSDQAHFRKLALPTSLTSLIGREQDISRVVTHLRRADVRLITLLGPPGVGKTRLAIEVARDSSIHFADGICFVALAPVANPDQVIPAIAQALGLASTEADPLTGIKLHLRDKQLLLVLDNMEHLLNASEGSSTAETIVDILVAAQDVKALVTSRTALRLSGELRIDVQPLDESAAVELFVLRAATVRSGIAPAPEDQTAIGELCRRLDRLPLAIELAAARIRLFSPQVMLTRLSEARDDSRSQQPTLDLLAEGPRDLPARQRTLRDTIAWSYHLLTAEQQRLLRHMSVFAGGCSFEAARAMVSNPPSFVADVQALLESSLLERNDYHLEGEPRFMLLEMIREFAAEQLVICSEMESAQERHAAYFLHWIQSNAPSEMREAGTPFRTAPRGNWDAYMERDYDNLRAALTWSLGDSRSVAHDVQVGSQLALWSFWLWFLHAPWSDATYWLERALAKIEPSTDTRLKASLLTALARFVGAVSNPARAVAVAQEALAIHKTHKDDLDILFTYWLLTEATMEQDDLGKAQQYGEQWLTLARHVEAAEEIAIALYFLGDIALGMSDFPQAARLLKESLQHVPGLEVALNMLGTLECYQGHYDRATALCDEALAEFRQWRWTHGIATVLHSLGDIALFQNDATRARARFNESLRLWSENGNKLRSLWCLGGLAALAATQDRAWRAVTLWTATEAIRASMGSPSPALRHRDYRALVDSAQASLDRHAQAAAVKAGSAMRFEQAVTYALSQDDLAT